MRSVKVKYVINLAMKIRIYKFSFFSCFRTFVMNSPFWAPYSYKHVEVY
jgi:hypothetical protein